MYYSKFHAQLREAFEASDFSAWELSRRANLKLALLEQALSGSQATPVGALQRLAHALDLELLLAPARPAEHRVGVVQTVVDRAIMAVAPEQIVHVADKSFKVLALDLEGTLISNAVSVFFRPGLARFLTLCRPLFERVVMFTTVKEQRFRQIAATLVAEGSAPRWFSDIEYIAWSGPTNRLLKYLTRRSPESGPAALSLQTHETHLRCAALTHSPKVCSPCDGWTISFLPTIRCAASG